MKKLTVAIGILALLGLAFSVTGGGSLTTPVYAVDTAGQDTAPLRCIAFGPHVQGYNPNTGPHPSRKLIRTLLDKLIQQTSFRCIMTYTALRYGATQYDDAADLNYAFKAAQARGMQVIAIIWLSDDNAFNDESVQAGIAAATTYPNTIIRLSCGSELRTRRVPNADTKIMDCLDALRAAGVTQPITSIETWWEWCDKGYNPASNACTRQWDIHSEVDWIGINVFPWWENKFSGYFPCTPAADAPDFHIARMQNVIDRFPGKEIILTEFGWPAGPKDYRETNMRTGQQCGVAKGRNQNRVIKNTLAKLDQKGWSAVVFEAFREKWKEADEGPVGPFWGICQGILPYDCKSLY